MLNVQIQMTNETPSQNAQKKFRDLIKELDPPFRGHDIF
jgi:hypothetical protein